MTEILDNRPVNVAKCNFRLVTCTSCNFVNFIDTKTLTIFGLLKILLCSCFAIFFIESYFFLKRNYYS